MPKKMIPAPLRVPGCPEPKTEFEAFDALAGFIFTTPKPASLKAKAAKKKAKGKQGKSVR